MVEAEAVRGWLQGYRRAWETNDPEDIGKLFTDEARYFTAPFREPWTGRETIVREWIERKDDPGTWAFTNDEPVMAGDLAFVRGETRYEDTAYSNLWEIHLEEDGRCSEFTEWWMEHK
jgi:ketosteroid isomerase-like protein